MAKQQGRSRPRSRIRAEILREIVTAQPYATL